MVGQNPRIYWFDTAKRWAITAAPLPDQQKAQMFSAGLRQQCAAIFNEIVHAWVVDDAHLPAAKELVKRYYGRYDFIDRPPPKQSAPPPKQPPPPPRPRSRTRETSYRVFCALVGHDDTGDLSYEHARSLYRRAAARLHPDTGGSSDKMAALNVAWVAVRELLT